MIVVQGSLSLPALIKDSPECLTSSIKINNKSIHCGRYMYSLNLSTNCEIRTLIVSPFLQHLDGITTSPEILLLLLVDISQTNRSYRST